MLTVALNPDPMLRLRRSKFRMDFQLAEFEKDKIREYGIDKVFDDIMPIILNKLDDPILDGKQTPFYGHPVFKAMHATACCCRKCLFKWHRIPPHSNLSPQDINYIQDLIFRWIRKQMYM